MEPTISIEQLDKIMKSYFDYRFDGYEFGIIKGYSKYKKDFKGLYKKTPKGITLLAGYPIKGMGHKCWYVDIKSFSDDWNLFGISEGRFIKAVSRYIIHKYRDHLKQSTIYSVWTTF